MDRERLTEAQARMLRAISAGDTGFGGRLKDLRSLQTRKFVHRIGPRYWLTTAGQRLIDALNRQPDMLGGQGRANVG